MFAGRFFIEVKKTGKCYSYDGNYNLHVSGTKDVELFVKQIGNVANLTGDDETAHMDEDNLYEAVLKEVVKGNPEARSMAAEALKTKAIKFGRW